MNIFLMGSRQAGKMTEFERFASTAGKEVRLSVIDKPTLPDLPELADEASGVVLFDDGKQSTAEWIANVREQTRYLSVPVIAVACRPDKEIQARLLAAGASAVCDCTSSNEHILSEIQNQCNSEPVLEEIRTELLGPFTSATTMTFREMAGVEITTRSIYQKKKHKMFGDISAVIGLMARTEGAMVISFPEESALAITRRILAGLADEPDSDVIRDCIGEVANVIVGQARGILANTPYSFAMSTPTVVSGAGHEIRHKPGMPCLVVAFSCELGDFALQLCLGI